MKRPDDKTLILTGIMFVVIVLLTWLVSRPIPYHDAAAAGYWTLGDVGIYLSVALLGGPWAALAAGLGAALADIIVGQAIYAPASLLIKAGMALAFAGYLRRRSTFADLIKAVAVAGGIMTGGYFFYDLIFRGNYILAAIGIPFNILQVIASGLIAVPVLFLMGGKTYRQGGGFAGARDDFSTPTKRRLK